MSLFGSKDLANNAPKSAVAGGLGVAANGQVLFGNTQVGTFGVDKTEAGIVGGEGKKVAHAGWNLRKQGVGPVVSITANTGAVGTNSYVTFSGGGTPNVAANASVVVNGGGQVVQVVINTGGQYPSTPAAVPASGNAVFTVVMGGRANRVQYETLVAMGSMTGDGSDDALLPDV